jgi:hypothetical protein
MLYLLDIWNVSIYFVSADTNFMTSPFIVHRPYNALQNTCQASLVRYWNRKQRAALAFHKQGQSFANNNTHLQNRNIKPVNYDISIENTAINLFWNAEYSLPLEFVWCSVMYK